jgi:hypothetical protein
MEMKLIAMAILLTLLLVGLIFVEGASAAEDDGHEHNQANHFSLSSLVAPLGIATLSCVWATFLTGLFRRKLGRSFQKIHLALAIASVALGAVHGTLVFVLFG